MSQTPPASPHPPRTAPGGGPGRIVREPDDRMIAGVCGGLADHLGVDVTVVRVVAVVLALVTPAALVAYLVASVVVPERRPDEPRVRAPRMRHGRLHPLVAVAAIVALVAIVDHAWWLEPFPAAVALVGVGVWLIAQGRDDRDALDWSATPASPAGVAPSADVAAPADRGAATGLTVTDAVAATAPADADDVDDGELTESSDHDEGERSAGTPPQAPPWWATGSATGSAASAPAGPAVAEAAGGPAPPDTVPARASRSRRSRSRLGSAVIALLFIGGGTLWLLDTADVWDVSGHDALALGLVAVGLGLIVAAWRGRAGGLVPVGCVLAALVVVGETLDVPLDAGTGGRTVVVDTARELDERHELFAGELEVDLTEAPVGRSRSRPVEAAVGMGSLRVVVPRDATVRVTAAAGAGDVTAAGAADPDETGVGVEETFTLDGEPGGPRLALDLSVGLGTVAVVRG